MTVLSPRSSHPALRAAPRRVEVNLSARSVEAIAARVAGILMERDAASTKELISAGELARRLRVERPWVYRHRELLGGIRIGTGPKSPWRFDYEKAIDVLRRQGTATQPEPTTTTTTTTTATATARTPR